MADYSLICSDPEWHAMLVPVLLVVVLFAAGTPFLFAFLLWRRRDQLDDEVLTLGGLVEHDLERPAVTRVVSCKL